MCDAYARILLWLIRPALKRREREVRAEKDAGRALSARMFRRDFPGKGANR